MTTNQIRRKWLDFFVSKNHLEIEPKSLIPVNDDSLLWINSGVATLKNFFSGKETPPKNSLVNCQKSIRTNDIENIGLTSRHHTFFEMLGSFSIGGYFRKQAIELAAEFLLKELKIDNKLLYITVYEQDSESYDLWIKNGMLEKNIIKCDKSRNFWEIGAGPCGPCTEIFYDRGKKFDFDNIGEKLFFEDIENDRYIEIWNIVFSEFNNDGKNNYTKLARQNIDTGAGLERLACILQNVNTNYDTDAFLEPRKVLEEFTNKKYDNDLYFQKNKNAIKQFINKSFTVIIDHFKACIFAISDGAIPSNKDRGYILRKLLRRAFFHMSFLNLTDSCLEKTINKIIEMNLEYYAYLEKNKSLILNIFKKEYSSYQISIKNSLKFLKELILTNNLNEKNLFKLVDTYGFPIEIINELEQSNSLKLKQQMIDCVIDKLFNFDINSFNIDFNKFNQYFENHKNISKSNKEKTAISQQNANLINLDVQSNFDYEISFYKDSKVIKLFDENFNEVDKLNNQNGYVVFDKTCVYATSGGQVHDLGYINNKYLIDDVFKSANRINIHHVLDATLKINEIVELKHDEKRRKQLRIHHSTEHLLHAALKNVISMSIKQEGALKTPEKITFDYFYPHKLNFLEISKLEEFIRKIIKKSNDSITSMCTLQEAQKMGALAYFENVYKKIKGLLRVVWLDNLSVEICGGTHVKNTNDIFDVQIFNITSKGSGSWRIEALSGKENIDNFKNTLYKQTIDDFLYYKNNLINLKDIKDEIQQILKKDIYKIHYLELKNDLDILKSFYLVINSKNQKNEIAKKAIDLKQQILVHDNPIYLENIDRKLVMTALTDLINEKKESIFIVVNSFENSNQFYFATNENFAKYKKINFNDLINLFPKELGIKGGGKLNFLQGSFKNFDKTKFEKTINDYVKSL